VVPAGQAELARAKAVQEERVAHRPAEGSVVPVEAETTGIQALTDHSAAVATAARAASSGIYARISVVVAAVAVGAIMAAVAVVAVMGVLMGATLLTEAAEAEVRLILSPARFAFRVGKVGKMQRQTASSSSVGSAMKPSALSHFALSVCVAAEMLAACGGSQPPLSSVGTMPNGSSASTYAPQPSLPLRSRSGFAYLFIFKAYADGAVPGGPLVAMGDRLYGTTQGGGAHGRGTVFALTTSGAESVVYSFGDHGISYKDGAGPWSLIC
jgi:uncharacterized repeat protein (TIGR03803 family)